MSRPDQCTATRQYRLPRRTDYVLIPAPLDLSLPLATEKSPLPAIIVTPCSPSSSRDFSIAFLASPPKPSISQRFASFKHFNAPSLRTRSIIFLLVVIFILVCHLVTHGLATRHPYLELSEQTGEAHVVKGSLGWFDFRALFGREVGIEHISRALIAPDALKVQ
ncbi:hypothetical protein BDZ97DRAFT_687760 [Flammula alnicola]|nr:hypothetical protein BDZ97DRAFT_687760 [Flammula alnicola]